MQQHGTTTEHQKSMLSSFHIPGKGISPRLSVTRKKIKKMNDKYELVMRTLQEIQNISQDIFSDETDPFRILVETAISMHQVHPFDNIAESAKLISVLTKVPPDFESMTDDQKIGCVLKTTEQCEIRPLQNPQFVKKQALKAIQTLYIQTEFDLEVSTEDLHAI